MVKKEIKPQKTKKLLKEILQDLQIRNESLAAINTVADRIYRSSDYKTVAKEAIAAMIQYGKTPTVAMFEYNEAEKCLIMIDHSKSIKGKESVELTRKMYLDESSTGRAVLEKKIVLCPDIAKDARILPATKKALLKEGRKSIVFIPLLFQNRVMGVMNLLFPQKYTFADYELETLFSIGKTIGLAMANARNIEKIKAEIEERKKTHEAMEQSIASLKAVNAVADRVYRALDYDTLNKEAISAVSSYSNTSEVSMYEYNEESDMLTVIGLGVNELSDEFDAVRLGRKLSAKDSIGGAAIHERNIIVCTNIPEDKRIRSDIKAAIIKDGRKVVISIPLLFQNRAMGVMNLFFNEAVSFNDYQLDTFFSIGKTIGLAMANARHIQQIKAEVEERKKAQEVMVQSIASLKTVNTVADRIYRALDYDTLIDEALTAMSHYGKATATFMYAYEEESDSLLFLDAVGMLVDPQTLMINGRLPAKESLTGQAIYQKEIVICEDIATDDRIQPVIKEAMLKTNRAAAISIPLLFQDRALGAINLIFSEKINFTDSELETLFSIGKTIGLAMANARHIQQIKAEMEERKIAQEALRQSEEKYRTLIETTDTGFVIIDKDGLVRDANPEYVRLTGHHDLSEIVGRNVMEWTADSEKEKNAAAVKTCFEQGYIRNLEINYIDAKGNVTPIEINATCMEIDGKMQIITICRDITERKRVEEEKRLLEERLQRTEKMEALGLLAGGVAHDLNNVLGVVVGYAEMLLDEVDESSTIRGDLIDIMDGGQHAAAIVQDLLTLARRGVAGRKVLNLNRLIRDFQKSSELEKLLSYHPTVRIKTDLECDLLNISGSSVHLEKTLFNLVSNANEAMPDGGTLTIKTTNQYMNKPVHGYDSICEGNYVVLSVSDMGEGIPESDLKRIFEPFYTKKIMGRSGTGLGLAVVWGTVKDHNGYINVKSKEGKGTTFTLYFPVTREEIKAEVTSAVSMSEYMGSGESILVVDDVKGQRDLTAAMLKKLNYNVQSVSSGEDAVTYLKKHKVDLLVLDMIMEPGMDGLDTYKSVLEIHPKQKAIIVSGFSESDRVNAAHALGAGAYLRKPYVIENIGMAVRKELDRK